MPWLVSMRMRGQVIGALVTTAMRRSVIFRSDGLELVLVFCGRASSVSSAQNAAPKPAVSAVAEERRKLRLPANLVVMLFMSVFYVIFCSLAVPGFQKEEAEMRVGVFTALL